MFQETYRAAYHDIRPDESLIIRTVVRINERCEAQARGANKRWLRPALAAAAVILIIVTAMPVMAANVPAFYELLYRVSPETAQFFMPVRKACEDNGIRMEVIATYIHEDTAEIYITLQDLTRDRVDATTDLLDSYDIHRPFDSSAHCERVGFDAATKTATFLLTVTEWGNHQIKGDKLTFSFRCFVSNKTAYEEIPINVDLGTVSSGAATMKADHIGGGGLNFEKYFPREDLSKEALVLAPSARVIQAVDGIDITGIGYIGGMLHIQTAVRNALKTDNHGFLYLKDDQGNEILSEYSMAFVTYDEPGNPDTRVDYNEFVFDIPQEGISDDALFGSFYTSGLYTEGYWQVTFPLSA